MADETIPESDAGAIAPTASERRRAYIQEYWRKYPEKRTASKLRWQQKNPERFAELRKQYNAAYEARHKDEIRRRQRERYALDPARFRENANKWVEKNKDRVRAAHAKQKSARRGAAGSFTAQDIAEIKTMQRNKCADCGRRLQQSFHIDHIMPIALGGTNDRKNLQLMCASCNSAKGARHPLDHARVKNRLL